MRLNHHPKSLLVCVSPCAEPAARAHWAGHLKLAHITCPIALTPATSDAERVSFRLINTRTGNRLRQQLVDDVSREPVEAEDRGKAYEIAKGRYKGRYLHVTEKELDAIRLPSNHTIEIDRFVPAAHIDRRFHHTVYDVTPNGEPGVAAFAGIRDAMRGKGMVALARVVLNRRERVIALEPHGKGLLATTLYYPYEVRQAEDHFGAIPDVKVPGEMRKLAEVMLDRMAGKFDLAKFADRYENALVALIRRKQAKLPAEKGRGRVAARRSSKLGRTSDTFI
jgi:DNA end-binding protein Ku